MSTETLSRDARASRHLLHQLVHDGQIVASTAKKLGHRAAIDHLVERGLAEIVERPTRIILRATARGREELAR